jgi:hypothetical protein
VSIGPLGKSISDPVRIIGYALTKRRRVSPRPQTATISGGHPDCGRPPAALSGRQFGCQHRNAPCLPAHCGLIGDRYAMSHRHAPLTHQTEREISRNRPETHARPDGQGADPQGQPPHCPADLNLYADCLTGTAVRGWHGAVTPAATTSDTTGVNRRTVDVTGLTRCRRLPDFRHSPFGLVGTVGRHAR